MSNIEARFNQIKRIFALKYANKDYNLPIYAFSIIGENSKDGSEKYPIGYYLNYHTNEVISPEDFELLEGHKIILNFSSD